MKTKTLTFWYASLDHNFIIKGTSYEQIERIKKNLVKALKPRFYDYNLTFEKAQELSKDLKIVHWANSNEEKDTEILFFPNEEKKLIGGFFDSELIMQNKIEAYYKAMKNGLLKSREEIIENQIDLLDNYDNNIFMFEFLK